MFAITKNRLVTALLAMAVMLISACGGSDSGGGSGNGGTPPPAATGTAVLTWTAPTQDTDGNALGDLSGYRIYYGTNASALNQTATVASGATLTHTLTGLAAGTWYFSITSVSGTGAGAVESDRTGTVSKIIP